MRLSLNEKPKRLHFDRPEKLYKDSDSPMEFPWLRRRRHFLPNGGKQGKGAYIECAGERCLACAYGDPRKFQLDIEPDKVLSRQGADVFIGVSGWVEEWYHLVTQAKRNNPKETFNSREPCDGRGCKHCQAKAKRVFGQRFFHAFSDAQWRVILDVYEKVERICRCKDEDGNHGYLYPLGYVCEKCDNLLIDLTNSCPSCGPTGPDGQPIGISVDPERHAAECSECHTSWSLLEQEDAELQKMVNEITRCGKCRHDGYPRPKLLCTTPDCEGKPHDIYDVQLTLRREGTGKQSKLVVVDWKIQEPDPRLFEAKFQGEGEGAIEVAKRHREHINLEECFAPDPPSVQAETLGRENLFRDAGATQEHKEYKGGRRQSSDEESSEGASDEVENGDDQDEYAGDDPAGDHDS